MNTDLKTVQLPSALVDKVDAIARRLDRPSDLVIEQAISEWAEREEYDRQRTLKGLADVDAGRLVAHEAVQAWADSLGTSNELSSPRSHRR